MAKKTDIVALYLSIHEQRLTAAKVVKELEAKEKELKEQIIELARSKKYKELGASASLVTLSSKLKPLAAEWQAIYEWIHRTRGFDILQRRLTESAVALRWEEGIIVPGIDKLEVFDVTIRQPG